MHGTLNFEVVEVYNCLFKILILNPSTGKVAKVFIRYYIKESSGGVGALFFLGI